MIFATTWLCSMLLLRRSSGASKRRRHSDWWWRQHNPTTSTATPSPPSETAEGAIGSNSSNFNEQSGAHTTTPRARKGDGVKTQAPAPRGVFTKAERRLWLAIANTQNKSGQTLQMRRLVKRLALSFGAET